MNFQKSILTGLIAASLLWAPALPGQAVTVEELRSIQRQVQAFQEHARKAVVVIECGGGTASGVIVTAAGLVLTAAHVTAEPGRKVKVILSDGRTIEANSLGVDQATDAAMVQLPAPAKAWPYVALSRDTRTVKAGDWCFAMGHSGGWDAARGAVLRIGKVVKVSANMLQSDCVLMGGDSGGALFSPTGELIGIHSQIWQGRDQNLHVSMAPYLRSWETLKRGDVITAWSQGSGGWIGLSTKAGVDGLEILAVAPGSPATTAGLKQGDTILTVNNEPVSVPVDFSRAIRSRTAGQLVTLKLKSTQGERHVEVVLGQRPED